MVTFLGSSKAKLGVLTVADSRKFNKALKDYMIDAIIRYLGELPKEQRNAILMYVDLATWAWCILSWFIDLSFPVMMSFAVMAVLEIGVSIKVHLVYGGWW